MSLPAKPKSQPVIIRTLLAGALAASSLVACGDDGGGKDPIDARPNIDAPAPQPPPADAQATDAQASDAQASDAQGTDATPTPSDAQLP